MNNFLNELDKKTNIAFTANEAKSYATSGSNLLDFFSKSGSLRHDLESGLGYFIRALAEDEVMALRALFYARDVRGGQGERDLPRIIMRFLAKTNSELIARNMHLIPEFGRWDDLYIFTGTKLEEQAYKIMHEQFSKDMTSDSPSLLGKWLKSENTSSKDSRELARITLRHFKMTPKEYRKALVSLRNKINILEQKISNNKWDNIDYSSVPSQAARIYRNAFLKHDAERYVEFLNKVEKGEETINADTLYPYQITHNLLSNYNINENEIKSLDVLWNNLPNYLEEGERAISVVDTSGSMHVCISNKTNVQAIDVALSLGIYFAERNTGVFKDRFLTFSRNPKLQKIIGKNIYEKLNNLFRADWDANTDLMKVFLAILGAAKQANSPKTDLPNKIFIISDMQFDVAVRGNDLTNFEAIDKLYKEAGYKRPELVFWNVRGYDDSPVTKDETGAYLVSGFSPSILKYALKGEERTALDLMNEVLNSERYSIIK